MPLRYLCIIYFNFEHRAPNYYRKVEVQKMFRNKPNTTTIVVTKSLKPDNVPINVIAIVITHS
jgi:hypothetical protein